MPDKPRILWIDDVYGKAQNRRNEERYDICYTLRLTDRTGDCVPDTRHEENDEDAKIADVTFCRGQIEEPDGVRNDYKVALKAVRKGWNESSRWSLLLLDMEFKAGPIGEEGKPVGRPEDSEPQTYYGLTILQEIWSDPDLRRIPVVVTSGMARRNIEERFAKLGVKDFVTIGELNDDKLQKLLDKYGLLEDDETIERPKIIGRSVPLLMCLRDARQRAKISDDNILILGETGTGKELLVKYIQRHSGKKKIIPYLPRFEPDELRTSALFGHKKGSYTGAVTERIGLVEKAEGGILFIDEFGNMRDDDLESLLRLLDMNTRGARSVGSSDDEKEFKDLQIVLATEYKKSEIEEKFRESILSRIQVENAIQIPTLSERSEDIPLLVDHFVKKYEKKFVAESREVSSEVYEKLKTHPWSGNIRQLENVIRRAVSKNPGLKSLVLEHINESLKNIPEEPIPLNRPRTDLDSVSERQSRSAETHIHKSLHELIEYLENFSFDSYQYPDLSGKLPELEEAYAKLVANYLKTALSMRGGIEYQVAMKCLIGPEVSGTAAEGQIQKILWIKKPNARNETHSISKNPEMLKSFRKFVEEDPILKEMADIIQKKIESR